MKEVFKEPGVSMCCKFDGCNYSVDKGFIEQHKKESRKIIKPIFQYKDCPEDQPKNEQYVASGATQQFNLETMLTLHLMVYVML